MEYEGDMSMQYGGGMQHAAGGYGGGPPSKKSRGDADGDYSEQTGNGGGGYPSERKFNVQQWLERSDEKIPPNHIILVTVFNAKFPINVEVIYKVCNIVGRVKRIVCFERMNVTQCMVEFETLESASKARSSLHGCDIYNNCCTMKVEYSKMESLVVRENNAMSWDFTSGEPEGKRPVILNEPDYGGYGGGYAGGMGGMGGMGGGMGANGMGAPPMPPAPGYGGGSSYGGYGGSNEDRSCVMLVYGLEPPKWNCERLFNLICQYGNVNKIFFMKAKPNTAMVEMGSPEGVENVTRNLHNVEAFGEKLRFDVSKKHIRINNNPPEFVMTDGSSSVKEYYNERNMNRFLTTETSRKNRIIHPSKVVHFFNIPKISDTDLANLFRNAGAVVPTQIKWMPPKNEAKVQGVGLCYFDNVEDATEAMILVNHQPVDQRNIKLCFSPAKY